MTVAVVRLFVSCGLASLLSAPVTQGAPEGSRVVHPEDYGAAGDGKRDDAAALAKAVAALRTQKESKVLEFGEGKIYRLGERVKAVYALELTSGMEVRGRGATMLIAAADKRAIRIAGAERVVVRDLKIDYERLPFTQGKVVATDPKAGTLDVRISPEFDLPADFANPPSNPPFFGKVYRKGGRFAHHYVHSLRQLDASQRLVRVQAQPRDVRHVAHVALERTMVIPILGRGQLEGGPVLEIRESSDVRLEDVSIYAAPLFASVIRQNGGPVHFQRVAVRPPPGSSRLISSWRDAFHVKDNRAAVTFDGCYVERPQDDAFNISAHWLPVREMPATTRLKVGRPHGAPLPRAGDTLQAYDPASGGVLGTVKVTAVAGRDRVEIAEPVPGLAVGKAVLALEACNPGSWVRNCGVIGTGLRLRSPLRFENNTVDGGTVLVSAYDVEGPVPHGIVFRGNTFKHIFASIWVTMEITGPRPAVRSIRDVTFEKNTFHQGISLGDAEGLLFVGNDFRGVRGPWIRCDNLREFRVRGLKGEGQPVSALRKRFKLGKGMTWSDVLER